MKKMLMLFMTLLMCALVFAGCSSDGSDNGGGDPAEIKGEVYDAGNVSALVPEGWMAFPVSDMWSDDTDATDPDQLQICKDAESEWDLLTKPMVDIVYYDASTSMMTPSAEWYDETEELEPMEIGGKTWNGFIGKSYDLPLAILWTGESDGDQFQVTIWLETAEGSVSIDDADVQAIIGSIQPSAN